MDEHTERSSAWIKYNVLRRLSRDERDSDPIRAARSKAYTAAFREEGCSTQQALDAANAAELETRRRLGLSEIICVSDLATNGPNVFPSDARCIQHIPADQIRR